jgi:group II intron reverse transcriptase/maturase
MTEIPSSENVSTKLERIAKLAKQMPGKALTSLSHHIDVDWLREAYRRTRKSGAPGVDGQTAEEYAVKLEGNLRSLLDRAKSGDGYRAPPVRRVYIPKEKGKPRPIGIPTFEDKVLQRAAAMALEAVYEQDFLDCSYGFRPGRSAHDAISAVRGQIHEMSCGWILEGDIEGFFDAVDHAILRDVLRKRVGDGVLLRWIGKWLNAGVMEEGVVHHPETGTPQGGVISPLLANVLLHEVLDEWFEQQVKPRLEGQAFLVRYADDFVIGFALETDANRVLSVLPKRFEKYGLRLHPTKTKLTDFRRPSWRHGVRQGRPKTFDLLGFTHYWARSQRGFWVVKRQTASSRLSRALRRIAIWCRANRHLPITDQHQALVLKVRGHYGYYGLIGNDRALGSFRYWVSRIWLKWLARRSYAAWMSGEKQLQLLRRLSLPLPQKLRDA